jgi:hypothetical protein
MRRRASNLDREHESSPLKNLEIEAFLSVEGPYVR